MHLHYRPGESWCQDKQVSHDFSYLNLTKSQSKTCLFSNKMLVSSRSKLFTLWVGHHLRQTDSHKTFQQKVKVRGKSVTYVG